VHFVQNFVPFVVKMMPYLLYSDEYFMNEALKEARSALEKEEIPVGAVVVCDNTIIARAHNLTETLNDVTAHAEMQAITAAASWLGGKYLNDCTVYVPSNPASCVPAPCSGRRRDVWFTAPVTTSAAIH
jgi:tRNA(Arg) A34 adenosine deaminase TadA